MKSPLIEETHASLYEFVTDLKNDPLPVQYSRTAQADFDARHHAWRENRITAFKNSSKSVDDNYRTPEFVFTYGHAQLWINLTLKNLTILGHPTAVANYRYFHVPVNYARDVTLTDNLGVSRPPRRTPSTLLNRAQYWDYQQRLRAAGVDLINS